MIVINNTFRICILGSICNKFNCYYYDQKIGIKSKKLYFSLTNPSYMLEMVFVFHSNPANINTILIQFSGHNAS